MKKIRQTTHGLALFALLAFGGISVAAKTGSAERQRPIAGVVTRVNFSSRVVEVREKESGRIVNVQVPDGMTVKSNLTMAPALPLERLLPGMSITAIVQ